MWRNIHSCTNTNIIKRDEVNMTPEQYIEHEVKLRVMKEVNDEKFTRLETKMNWIISLVVGGWMLPIALHFLKLV